MWKLIKLYSERFVCTFKYNDFHKFWRKISDMLIKLSILAIVPLAYTFTQAIVEEIPFKGYLPVKVDSVAVDVNRVAIEDATLAAVVTDHYENHSSLKVCTKFAGCMIGKLLPGYRIDYFEGFLGIPYALPPVGELRFSHPKAFPRSADVIDATQPKPDCIQRNALIPNSPISGSEDCLYLNVYRPIRHHPTAKLPVMVYIHGGGWFAGSVHPDITGPHYLMDTQEVIIVTFSYRLGVFGFLSTNDSIVPGNFGLKDQVLALKWVQKNIADFGGNPKQVTIFGQSAGAISAHMHMLSPQSENLFHKVIALSGTANVPFAVQKNGLELARKTAELCKIGNAEELSTAKLLKALRSVKPELLLNATDNLKYWDVDPLTLFRPVVEDYNSNEAFLTKHPTEIFESGNYKAVPFMAGNVPGEGAVRAVAILESERLRKAFDNDFDKLLEKFLELPEYFNRSRVDQAMQNIIEEYFGGHHKLNNRGFVDVVTDRGFHGPFYHAIKTYIETIDTQRFPLYLYNFNYSGPLTYSSLYSGNRITANQYGVVHCDELIYLFRSPAIFPDFPKISTEANVSNAFVLFLTNFAKYEQPFPVVDCNKYNFPSNSMDSICHYVSFQNGPNGSFNLKTENRFDKRRTLFWDEILKI